MLKSALINNRAEVIANDNQENLSGRQKLIKISWPIIFFGLMTAFFTYPLVFNFSKAVPGIGIEDRLQNLWNFWWIDRALSHFQNPYLTDRLFFPYYQTPGHFLPLYFHDLQFFNGLVTLPLQKLGGVAAAYNGVVFLATFVSGLATFWLVRRLGGSPAAGVLAGSIYAFAPIRLDAIDESITNIQSTEFLPLYALFLHAARIEGNKTGKLFDKRMVVGAILALTFCIYTDWYNTIYLLFFSLFYFGWHVLVRKPSFKKLRQETLLMLLIGALTFVLVAPLLIPSIANLNNPDFKIEPGLDREVKSSLKVLSIFLPNSIGPNWSTSALSYTGLILGTTAGLSLLRRKFMEVSWQSRSSGVYWLLFTLAALVMALGPKLVISSALSTDLPLPYALFRKLPVVSVTRAPGRFVIPVMLGLAVLAAYAVDWLKTNSWLNRFLRAFGKNFTRNVSGALLAAVSLVFFVLESWAPVAIFEVKNNPFLEKLAAEQGDFTLLELPITRHYNHDQVRMFNQIAHGRPIIGGYLSRPVVDPYRLPDSPFAPVADLVIHQKRLPPDIIPPTSNGDDLDNLVALYNFRYIVIYPKEFEDPDQLSGVSNLVANHYNKQVAYQDDNLIIYRIPDNYFQLHPPKLNLSLGSGFFDVEQTQNDLWRWTEAQSQIFATSTNSEKFQVKVEISAFGKDRTLQVQLNGQNIYQNKVPVGKLSTFTFIANLNPGRNKMVFTSLEGDQSPAEIDPRNNDDRRLAFAVHGINFSSSKGEVR